MKHCVQRFEVSELLAAEVLVLHTLDFGVREPVLYDAMYTFAEMFQCGLHERLFQLYAVRLVQLDASKIGANALLTSAAVFSLTFAVFARGQQISLECMADICWESAADVRRYTSDIISLMARDYENNIEPARASYARQRYITMCGAYNCPAFSLTQLWDCVDTLGLQDYFEAKKPLPDVDYTERAPAQEAASPTPTLPPDGEDDASEDVAAEEPSTETAAEVRPSVPEYEVSDWTDTDSTGSLSPLRCELCSPAADRSLD